MPQHIFDPHVHLIDLEKGDHHWLRNADATFLDNIEQIKRNLSAIDLQLAPPLELKASTHIEAGFDNDNPERELAFIAEQALLKAAVSYIPLDCSPNEFDQKLSLLLLFDKFVGIRDISEHEDYLRLTSKNASINLATLADNDLLFEAQFHVENIQAVDFFDSCAHQLSHLSIVINHCGFPTPNNFMRWRKGVERLANHQNIAIKFSGFEMLKNAVTAEFKQQVLDVLLASFTDNRVMFASNFPLCLTQKTYQEVWEEYCCMQLTPECWRKLSFENAKRIYSTITVS